MSTPVGVEKKLEFSTKMYLKKWGCSCEKEVGEKEEKIQWSFERKRCFYEAVGQYLAGCLK